MLAMIDQGVMERIFAVTDGLGIHREEVVVPLAARTPGRVRRMSNGKLEIVVDSQDYEAFLTGLEAELRRVLG